MAVAGARTDPGSPQHIAEPAAPQRLWPMQGRAQPPRQTHANTCKSSSGTDVRATTPHHLPAPAQALRWQQTPTQIRSQSCSEQQGVREKLIQGMTFRRKP